MPFNGETNKVACNVPFYHTATGSGLWAQVLLNKSSLSFLGYINYCRVKLEFFCLWNSNQVKFEYYEIENSTSSVGQNWANPGFLGILILLVTSGKDGKVINDNILGYESIKLTIFSEEDNRIEKCSCCVNV